MDYMNQNRDKHVSESQFLFNIIKSVENQIHRNLLDSEEDLIIRCVKTVYVKTLHVDDPRYQKVFKHITEKIIEELHLTQCEERAFVDTHEILKRHIGKTSEIEYMPTFEHEGHTEADEERELNRVPITKVDVGSLFGLSDIRDVVGKLSETTAIKHAYFMLDTKYRTLENDGTTCFKWSHINSVTRGQGTLNILGTIRDIVSMRTYPIRIPNVASAYTPYERISIFVEEFISQSYIAHENRNFHFIGDSVIKGNWVNVCPDDYNEGAYHFDKPITHIDTLTISFASPLEPIIFDKDRLQTTIISYATTTVLQMSENHNLVLGDTIYIDDFNTGSTNDLGISDIFNRQTGHSATVITPNTISIPVDTSGLNALLTGVVNTPNVVHIGTAAPAYNSNIILGYDTTFIADYTVGGYIQIFDSINSVFLITSITDNTHLVIDSSYTIVGSGAFIHGSTTTKITGVGTLFTTELKSGDIISIVDGVSTPSFVITSIESDLSLTTSPYNGASGAGFVANKDNRNASLSFSTFFGSKRIFIPMELTYLAPSNKMM
jgi:hypothetical protein